MNCRSTPHQYYCFIGAFLLLSSLTVMMCNGQMLLGVQQLARRRMQQQSWSDLIARETEADHLIFPAGTTSDIREQLVQLLGKLKSSLLPLASSSDGFNISQQCIEDSLFYVESLTLNRSDWALQMLESSAQFPAGVFGAGNYHAEGLFDECLAVRAESNRYRGRYCTIFFKTEPITGSEILVNDQLTTFDNERNNTASPSTFEVFNQLFGSSNNSRNRVEPKLSGSDAMAFILPSLSLCIPSSCSASDLGQSVAKIVGSYVIGNQSIVTIADENYCYTEDNSRVAFDGPDIAVIVTLSVIGLAVVMATLQDSWRTYRGVAVTDNSKAVSVLHCFSALSNGRKILSLKSSASSAGSDNLSCLHGIRFFSTCWVVLGHTWIKSAIGNVVNPNMLAQDAMSWEMETIVNATVSVDTFFLMSGLLVSYLLLRELDRSRGKFNVALFYLHRYLRLTPVYAVILGYIATLMIYLGTGPNWYNVVMASDGCRVTWWKQFLYINNLFPNDMNSQCMGETWYVAVDMQLFLVAPLIIYPLWRWKKSGIILLSAFTLATVAANFAVYALYNLPPSLMATRMKEMMKFTTDYMDNYYFKPWTRAPPYLVGIWTGWFLHRVKQSKLRISPWIVALFWTLSAVIAASIIYGLTPYVNEELVPTINWAVKMTYGPLHRTAWALVLGWIIVACIHGYGGFVDRFLSWRGFLPLSRLTYCVYLIHYDYLNVFYSLNRKMIYYTFVDQLTTFFGITVTVFGLAFVVSVCVEAPFINLERWLFTISTNKTTQTKLPDETAKSLDGKPITSEEELNANGGEINAAFNSEESSLDSDVRCGTKL